jgi:hypothetical protein
MRNKTIDLLAHERHFFDHLMPMFLALPEENRGEIITRQALGAHVLSMLKGADVQVRTYAQRGHVRGMIQGKGNLMLVSSSGDLATSWKAGRWAVFTQHGAGQSFVRKSPSYAGWPHHKNVAMFIHPGPDPAAKDAAIYGGERVRIVGCPKMDPWHAGHLTHEPAENGLPNVVVSSHWDCKAIPETRSTFFHMLPGFQELAALNGVEFNLYGHGHPRALHQYQPEYKKRGIQVIKKFQDVLRVGDLYIMDQMSTLYEFASAGAQGYGRPVVVMNAPFYRKKVNHGLRFWDAAQVGINIWQPGEMVDAARRALQDAPEQQQARRDAIDQVYAYTDGRAAERAARAIMEAIHSHRGGTSITKRKTRKRVIKMSFFQRKQVALKAVVRIRNYKRGHTPKGGQITQGIDARRGRLFFTDEDHAQELVAQNAATLAPEHAFPGYEEQPQPIEVLTEANLPETEVKPAGGGYYELVVDGHVQGKYRGKKAAEAIEDKFIENWKDENLPGHQAEEETEEN